MKVVIVTAHGGPEVPKMAESSLSKPGRREALVEISAAGVNFMDIGVRNA